MSGPEFRPLANVERKFTNIVGNEIEVYVSTGTAADRYCRVCIYGPASSHENYVTFDELVQIHSAMSEALGIPLPVTANPPGHVLGSGADHRTGASFSEKSE